jgi:hypothetical protein
VVGPDKWHRHCSHAKDLSLRKCYSISERKKKRKTQRESVRREGVHHCQGGGGRGRKRIMKQEGVVVEH